MVKTEETTTMAAGWNEVFERSRVVPPPCQTVRLAVESHLTESHGFQLSLSRLTAAHLPQEKSEGEQDVTYQLRVTLFDRNHQQFFGKTWKSSPQKMKTTKISFNEALTDAASLVVCSSTQVNKHCCQLTAIIGLTFTIDRFSCPAKIQRQFVNSKYIKPVRSPVNFK
ncbi:hypothetical protein JOQ06_007673 [Pogonophryne albipinna]|uniref:Uncharacterized protein n=1 Tax=Pogonophryne albipinna TaxID=1090488 RepID=A0AAD6B159_9TELE|nr:hypothetical protein JOQ06_007673 [Pogonophryne albipinna]